MGGFVLADEAHDTSVLTPKDFRNLLADQEIGFPLISEKEIQDRSKGDGLSKALVVVQTTWFIAQCISRKVQGFTITEMELVTVAFAFLNGIMYFLWWNKPVDVTTSVRIYRLTSPIPHPPAISIARYGVKTSVRILHPPTSPFLQSPEISIARDGDSVLTPSEMLDFEGPPSSLDLCIRKSIHTTGYPVTIHETGSGGGLYSSLSQLCNDESCRSNITHEFNANSTNNNSANSTRPTIQFRFYPS